MRGKADDFGTPGSAGGSGLSRIRFQLNIPYRTWTADGAKIEPGIVGLKKKAAQTPQKLNWRTSIVDLMKLLGMESSLTERKELATELGCPAEYMHDSTRMNVWLHKEVLRQIAQNGGNVPAELYD